jgi:hypothetical protein
MHRMWMRGLVLVAVGTVSALLTAEANAQGPVRRLIDRLTPRTTYTTSRTVTTSSNRFFNRDGYVLGWRANRDRTWFASDSRIATRRSERGGGILARTRVDRNVVPATAIEPAEGSGHGAVAPAAPTTPTPPRTPQN